MKENTEEVLTVDFPREISQGGTEAGGEVAQPAVSKQLLHFRKT